MAQTNLNELLEAYKHRINTTHRDFSICRILEGFINYPYEATPTKISVLTLCPDNAITQDSENYNTNEVTGPDELYAFLSSPTLQSGCCRLFLVENICPKTMAVLDDNFHMAPEFFAKHIKNEPWFRTTSVTDCLPDFPSAQEEEDFIQISYIEPLSVYHTSYASDPDRIIDNNVLDIPKIRPSPESHHHEGKTRSHGDYASDFVLPDKNTTRILRKDGKFKTLPRPSPSGLDHFQPLLCTRQIATIWFEKTAGNGWIGVLLLDPVFQVSLKKNEYILRGSESVMCKQPAFTNGSPSPLESNRVRSVSSWINKGKLGKPAISDCFTALHMIYSLATRNWAVVNECINRELATIECILETTEPEFEALDRYLKALYTHRRRCIKYQELICRSKEQCSASGQRSWPRGSFSPPKRTRALERDFAFLQKMAKLTEARIDKTVELLEALVAIGEAKQGRLESKAITRLTLFATIFIPFSTVAAVLGMDRPFAPGASKFWIFWVVAVPLILVVMGSLFIVTIKKHIWAFPQRYPTSKYVHATRKYLPTLPNRIQTSSKRASAQQDSGDVKGLSGQQNKPVKNIWRRWRSGQQEICRGLED